MASLAGIKLNTDVKPAGKDFEILPEGRYKGVILEDELKPNSAKTGQLLEIIVQVTEGEFEGSQVLDRLNLQNPSEVAEKIGQGTLKTLCLLTGTPYPVQDTRVMWGKPFMFRVAVEEFESNTEPPRMLQSNKIKGYSKWIEKAFVPEPAAKKPAQEQKVEKVW